MAGLLMALGGLLSGCATVPPKPTAMTDNQFTQALRHLRGVCLTLRVGDPVNVKFFEETSKYDKDIASSQMAGYFYAYNRWNDTITISVEPPTFFSSGTPYYLTSIESIAITPAQSVQAPATLAQALASVPRDYERDLLTQ
jgi:hypothetical protein